MNPRPAIAALLVWGPLLLAGCAGWGRPKVAADTGAGFYKKVTISYRADSEHVKADCAAPPSEGQLVSYQEPAVPLPDDTISTLEIRYPHPDGTPGLAQALVRIEARSQTESPARPSKSALQRFWNRTRDEFPGLKGSGWTHEVWAVDIPKTELDRMLDELRKDGFLINDKAAVSTTVLSMSIDGVKTNKPWRQVRELDHLIARVRTEGRLTTSTFPSQRGRPGAKELDTARRTWKRYTTLQAYRDLLARDAARGHADSESEADRVVRLPEVESSSPR